MSDETDLNNLRQELNPEQKAGEYVFCPLDSCERAAFLQRLCLLQETEGMTGILRRRQADEPSLSHLVVCTWIRLTVRCFLKAVEPIALVCKVLTEANIGCNGSAAHYHNRIVVPLTDADRATKVLHLIAG